ncbi:MAG: T9SS type A sorting domain-containing protein [Kordia sp.]|uniref:T9SS type A sorting domain-containing protein n=1 Tax=Kordia sp. TaxID=1965332 RepID=UPI003860078E
MKKHYIAPFLLLFSVFVSSQNVGILEIVSPDVTNFCSNVSETFTVTIKPDHSGSYDGLVPCFYQLNSDTIVQEDLNFVSFLNLNNSFSQEISPIQGMNTLRIWTDLPGDSDASNNEIEIQFDYSINDPTTPWTEDMEAFPAIDNPGANIACWEVYSVGIDGQPDALSTWGVIDASAYPNAPMPASGNKVFSPTLQSNLFSSLYLVSPDIDISTLSLAELSFDYHVYGRFQGELSVDIYHNGAWTNGIGAVTNAERQLEISDPWKKKTILLDGYDGSIKIRFTYADIDWVGWYSGDYTNGSFTGIDTIEVKEAPSCPSPKNVMIPFDEITTETANITWTAGHTETNWKIEYRPIGFTPGTGITLQTSQASYTITGLTAGTEYDVYVQAICGAVAGTDDSALVTSNFQTVCSVVAPWTEDVELQSGTTRGVINNCWKTDRYETHLYRWDIVNNGGGTLSNNTGPSQAYEGTNYFHIESSHINGGSSFAIAPDASSIYSPFIDVSGLTTPAVKFYYHMYGANIGSLSVAVFANGSWTEDVHVISGEQQTASNDPWLSTLVDLSAFSGEIRLRFTGMSASQELHPSDMAIDFIQVNEFQVLATSEVSLDLGIVMYPNPVDDILNIQSQENIDSIKICNIEGKTVLNFYSTTNENIKIPVAKFATGMYFIEVTSKQKKEVFKMVKR